MLNPSSDRLHGLDALRAFALLLGVLLHASVNFVMPPGAWAVGTTTPSAPLAWLTYYLHSFRLEIFFLMAGFFGALVVRRRGATAYAWDRVRRILLVFVVAVFPMRFVLSALWIAGGRATGWLQLPPLIEWLPWYVLAAGALVLETSLTHLWFLYYLFWISVLFLFLRWLAERFSTRLTSMSALDPALEHAIAGRAAPIWLALAATPLLVMMQGVDVDTPDRSFLWHGPVLLLYGGIFSLGWWLFHHAALLDVFASRWRSTLILGIATSFGAGALVALRVGGGEWAAQHPATLRWASSFGTSLTMMLSVTGWTGGFVRWFAQPSPAIRYVADASYWIYIVHLPVVVALQVLLVRLAWPSWLQLPLVIAATMILLLGVYHVGVRYTWVGAWLNGRRHTRAGRAGIRHTF